MSPLHVDEAQVPSTTGFMTGITSQEGPIGTKICYKLSETSCTQSIEVRVDIVNSSAPLHINLFRPGCLPPLHIAGSWHDEMPSVRHRWLASYLLLRPFASELTDTFAVYEDGDSQ